MSAPYLLKILVAPKFQNAIIFVILGAGVELCRVLGNLLSNAAQVKRNVHSLTLPYTMGSTLSISLIYFVAVGHMFRQVRFVLDIRRCVAAIAVMGAMAISVFLLPQSVSFMAVVGMLMLITAIAGIIVIALLWKNPATLRLINVKLREN